MKLEYCEKLCRDFPRLYNRLTFYFECGDGWFDLIYVLSKKLMSEIERAEKNGKQVDFYATQVKEKYGTLRYYSGLSYDFLDGIIEEAEEKSATICDQCGKAGEIRDHCNWYYTMCERCFNIYVS